MGTMSIFDAAIFAEARSMVDWNMKVKFCAGCGSPHSSLWAGWKLVCTSLLPWADNSGRKPCPTSRGLHNYTHPRTDAVVIMIAIDQTGDKILLGHNRKFPIKSYSALAGFIEPGESFEDAVKREMWEEAGVKAWDVTYHSGQPWPYPASLMVGFYARADSTQPIRTDLDNELVDAKWFSREEILKVMRNPKASGMLSSQEIKKLAELEQGQTPLASSQADVKALSNSDQAHNEPNNDEIPFRIPPIIAIAGVLVKDWAEGTIKVDPFQIPSKVQKGNL